jgi:hypothetical protein
VQKMLSCVEVSSRAGTDIYTTHIFAIAAWCPTDSCEAMVIDVVRWSWNWSWHLLRMSATLLSPDDMVVSTS